MNDFTAGQLTALCQMVYRGSKPCAVIPILNKDFQIAKSKCIMENCKFKGVKLNNDWVTFWIYIRDEISEIIDTLPQTPETKADHYILGSLFGYSNNAICDFISKQITSNLSIDIDGIEYPLHRKVFELIKATSKERDNYRLIASN